MHKNSWIALALALGLALGGCPGDDDDDTTTDDDDIADDDATDDDDDATDDDDDTADDDDDDDTSERIGLSGKSGAAVAFAGAGYTGPEDMYFIADDGDGEDVCRIRYELTSVAERFDCEVYDWVCIWAFDLVLDKAAVVAESDVGCEGVFGLDEAGVAALAGTEITRGYLDEYFGHTSVLLELQPDETWAPFCNATWDSDTGLVEYNWVDSSLPY